MARENSRRFHFLKEIASGGFGSVYLAKVMHADGFSRLAAIKLLHQRWSENAEIAQRMRDEARLLGWLRHRNIVDVIDLTTIGGRVAVIMEYLEAVDLKGAASHVAERGEKMPPRAALEIAAFVASALDAAYNRPPYEGEKPLRVIHRDIKPSNVMVDESGTVKVLDFGVARADFDHRESHTQELQFGSVDYMPPERLFFEPETPFSDVYSLGATLYEILALEKLGKAKGRPEKHAAFLEDRLRDLRGKAALDGLSGDATIDLIREMCAYNHEGRPAAADVVVRCRALSRAFEGEGLGEWAERLIPPLVKAAREAPREPNPLTDSILTEDSASFKADDTFVDTLEEGGVVVRAQDPIPSRIPSRDDELFRKAALTEIAGPSAAGGGTEEIEVVDETPPAPSAVSRTWDDDPSAGVDPDAATRVGPPPSAIQEALRGMAVRPEAARAPAAEAPRTASPPSRGEVPRAEPDPFATGQVGASKGGSRTWIWVAVAVVVVLGLAGAGGLVLAGSALLGASGDGAVATADPSGTVGAGSTGAATSGAGAAAAAPALPAGGIHFVSAAPDTAKIVVSCDGKEVGGALEAAYDVKEAKSCAVKVILKDRSRLVAEVAAPTEGTYTCFAGGTKECIR